MSQDPVQDTLMPTVNVFIENSKSMDGYVRGQTSFKNTVYQFLSDIRICDVTKGINLYYINSIIPWRANDANNDQISDFIEKLDPKIFELRGGNRQDTDISKLLKKILEETDTDEVSIFITDGSFSPGKKDQNGKAINPDEYLMNQQTGIKVVMSDYLKKCPDAAVTITQKSSQFDGTYYDKENNHISYKGQRPYYIWIIGKQQYLSIIMGNAYEALSETNDLGKSFSAVGNTQHIDYAIVPKSGTFQIVKQKDSFPTIKKLKKSPNGRICFAIDADLKEIPFPENILTDPDNWVIDNYNIVNITRNPAGTRYSHRIFLDGERVRNGQQTLRFVMAPPDEWSVVNDTIGEKPINNATYGIMPQVRGVYEAFKKKGTVITEIKVNVQ